jgi:A/G-specific adenine glycosylase
LHPTDVKVFRRSVLAWSAGHVRALPWREERDPYRVLVSEVMLQQTQAARVAPSYLSFLRRFPTVEALADAGPAEAMRAWGNLGYNRRALNLWRAARSVVERGSFPRTVEGLRDLPGVGPYTARAVAAFAFGAHTGAVDANVRRVLTRATGLAPDADVQELADTLAPRGGSGRWNQALFDLGADVCRPRRPGCGDCPVGGRCAWAAGHRPARARAGPSPVRFETTTRYARGRVVRALRAADSSQPVAALLRATGLDRERLEDALRTLERDGLVERSGARVSLPS